MTRLIHHLTVALCALLAFTVGCALWASYTRKAAQLVTVAPTVQAEATPTATPYAYAYASPTPYPVRVVTCAHFPNFTAKQCAQAVAYVNARIPKEDASERDVWCKAHATQHRAHTLR